jgi:hypothetical protein
VYPGRRPRPRAAGAAGTAGCAAAPDRTDRGPDAGRVPVCRPARHRRGARRG